MSSFTFSASALQMQFADSSKFAIPFPTLSFKCQKHVIISRNVKLGSRILPALKSSDQEMENEGSSEIANDPSTSFLSLLCPLLKLFSVSLFFVKY
uniref:Uncharacterized protein n=1 Tax=Solanum tuberosum TaxID=4113 RepID=M1AQA3_SOLTU